LLKINGLIWYLSYKRASIPFRVNGSSGFIIAKTMPWDR
jgi:hypothetical protein